MGFDVVDIVVIKSRFGNEGIYIKNAQIVYDVVSWDIIVLILWRLCQCYDNAALDCWPREIASKLNLVFRYRPSTVTHRLSKLSKSFAVVGRRVWTVGSLVELRQSSEQAP